MNVYNIKDFKTGDTVFVVEKVRNYSTGKKEDRVREEKVVSVGRKYIHVSRNGDEYFTSKFSVEDYFAWGLIESVDIGEKKTLFKSVEDYNGYIKREELSHFVYDKLCYRSGLKNLNLEQLEAIKKIIEEGEKA